VCFNSRKYKELTLKERVAFFAGVISIILVTGTLLYVYFLTGTIQVEKKYKLNFPLGLTYESVANFYKLSQWAPDVIPPDTLDSLTLSNGQEFLFHTRDGEPFKMKRKYWKKYRGVTYQIDMDNISYILEYQTQYIDDTITDFNVCIYAPLTKKQAFYYNKTKDTIIARMDRMVDTLSYYLAHQDKFYSYRILSDTEFVRKPYLFMKRKVKAKDFLRDFTEKFPEILIYGVQTRLLQHGQKSVSIISHCEKDYFKYAVGFPLKSTEVHYDKKKYVMDSLPPGAYKPVLIKGDYNYSPIVFYKAWKELAHQGYVYDTTRPPVYEYLKGHSTFPDNPEKWETKLYYPVQKSEE